MTKHRQRKSKTEKLEIIHFSKQNSVLEASREFGISTTIIYKWLESYSKNGEDGLVKSGGKTDMELELKRMIRENNQLKKLVAEKELRLMIQKEMLK